MKRNITTFIACAFLLLLASCSSEQDGLVGNDESGIVNATTLNYTEQQIDDSIGTVTRAQLIPYDGGLLFRWEEGDRLAIFAYPENTGSLSTGNAQNNIACYQIDESCVGKNTAKFTNSGFPLVDGTTYLAFYPWGKLTNASTVDPSNATLSYDGQRQLTDNSTAHLGNYDYQAAMTKAESGEADFDFCHLGAVLNIQMLVPEGGTFNELDLMTADDYEFQMSRDVNLLGINGADVSSYSPFFKSVEYTGKKNNQISLKLGSESGEGITVAANGILKAYIMIPATTELYQKTVYAVLRGVSGQTDYYSTFEGKQYLAGKKYAVGRKAYAAGAITEQIMVYKDWQNGGTKDVTRAGDPGTTTTLSKPKHLIIYTCADGYVKKIDPIDTDDADWSDNGDYWQYKTISFNLSPKPSKIHVYAVAYNEAITIPDVSEGDAESKIQSLTFTVANPGDDATGQKALLDTYTVPYTSTNFTSGVEDVASASVLSITSKLYHVASKVDVNWDCPDKIVGNITANNLLSTGYLFLPTQNVAATTTDTYTLHTDGVYQQHYGRKYFYAIQNSASTLNLSTTIGGSTTTADITMTPGAALEGCTSWFRVNVK